MNQFITDDMIHVNKKKKTVQGKYKTGTNLFFRLASY